MSLVCNVVIGIAFIFISTGAGRYSSLTSAPPPYVTVITTEFPPPVVVESGVAAIVGSIVYVFESTILLILVFTLI